MSFQATSLSIRWELYGIKKKKKEEYFTGIQKIKMQNP